MAEMLLLNPAPRRNPKRRSAAQRAATARLVALNRSRRASNPRRRRRNPANVMSSALFSNPRRRRRNPSLFANPVGRRHRRRRNPSLFANPVGRRHRRRRNPIHLGGMGSGIGAMLKEAAIGGAGALAVDVIMGYVQPYLPASMLPVAGQPVGLYQVAKAGITVALGKGLSRHTKGLSQKMAVASLTVQMHEILKSFVPSTMTLGYNSPARVAPGSFRVGPNVRSSHALGRFVPGATPMLAGVGKYSGGNRSPLLAGSSSRMNNMQREGFFQR